MFLLWGSRKEWQAAAKDTIKEEDEAKAIVVEEDTSEKSITQVVRIWFPPPDLLFFLPTRKIFGEKHRGQWAEPSWKFWHFHNEKLEFYNNF